METKFPPELGRNMLAGARGRGGKTNLHHPVETEDDSLSRPAIGASFTSTLFTKKITSEQPPARLWSLARMSDHHNRELQQDRSYT